MAIDGLQYRAAPSRFWRWWTAELAHVASIASPARLGFGAAELTVSQAADGTWMASPASRDSAPRPLAFIVEQTRPRTATLKLAASDCFVRRVTLPDVAQSEIARLLALDLERTTPFKTSETYCGHVVSPDRARPGFVSVLHVIVPRDIVEAKRAELELAGVRVTRIDCSNADATLAPLNLLAASSRDPATPATFRAWRWLVPAVALLTASAIIIDSSRQDAATATLTADTNDALAVLKSRQQSSRSAEAALAQAIAVERLAQTTLPRTRILNELAQMLPDSVWLTDIRLDGDVIDISGNAKSAAALVGLFESSNTFTGAELTSAITRVEDINRERFSLRARVKSSANNASAAPEKDRSEQ